MEHDITKSSYRYIAKFHLKLINHCILGSFGEAETLKSTKMQMIKNVIWFPDVNFRFSTNLRGRRTGFYYHSGRLNMTKVEVFFMYSMLSLASESQWSRILLNGGRGRIKTRQFLQLQDQNGLDCSLQIIDKATPAKKIVTKNSKSKTNVTYNML